MQKAYITALYDLMERDSNVVSLLSDSGTDYDTMMSRDFPNQCFNFGIAEQNKVGAAAGMAAIGKIPFVYTTGAFIAYRAYEFVRNDICFQKRNVKLVGVGMGVDMGGWSTLGASHHTTEDIAVLRSLPNLTLLCAASPIELQQCVAAAYEICGPVYIRMGMSGEREIYSSDYHFETGHLSQLMQGEDIAVFTTGTITANVLDAADKLKHDRISVAVYNVHTLSPIDRQGIVNAVQHVRHVFTVEEHQIAGGLGGAVAEVLAEQCSSVPFMRIGLDGFAKGYGKAEEVRCLNRLDSDGIYRQIRLARESI